MLSLALVLSVASASLAVAQAVAQDDVFTGLRDLPPGSTIRLTMREQGTHVTGVLVRWEDGAIVMADNHADRLHPFVLPPGATLRDAVPFTAVAVSEATVVQVATQYRRAPSDDAAVARRVVREIAGRAGPGRAGPGCGESR